MAPSNSPPSSTPTKTIIGGAIGGTAFLLLILAAIFIPIFRQRRSCYDIALRRHTSTNTHNTTATSHRKDSMQEGKIVDTKKQVQSEELEMMSEHREDKEMLRLEEMVGLEEMLRIDFPNPSRYELDGGEFIA
jgi:hypothetical protein